MCVCVCVCGKKQRGVGGLGWGWFKSTQLFLKSDLAGVWMPAGRKLISTLPLVFIII